MSCTRTFSSASTRLALLIATLAVALSACNGSPQAVAPTPPPATTPNLAATLPALSSSLYSVRIQTTAVTGPDFCIVTPGVGSVFKGDYYLVSNGFSVAFDPPDPIDWDSFTATLTGLDFTGTNPTSGSGRGMCAHYLQGSTLTGSFSPDMSSFTAVENLYYIPDSGGVKTITFSWSGTRR